MNRAELPQTPAEALGPTIHETVSVEGHTFVIGRPDAVDRLIDYPVSQSPFAVAGEYMPYWAHLWPTARLLAGAVLRESWPKPRTAASPLQALDIGCGLGLVGLAALARGLHVIFSDYDATALRFAAENARRNDFADFQVLHMDLRRPPTGLQVPVVLGSDVIHEIRMAAPLAAFVRSVLSPGGLCLLTDKDRLPAAALKEALRNQGLAFTPQPIQDNDAGGGPIEGTLYRIGHAVERGT
jgi:predicted nicotinamide N-methyase